MVEQNIPWTKWIADLSKLSAERINYVGLSEELAKIKHSYLYDFYTRGNNPRAISF